MNTTDRNTQDFLIANNFLDDILPYLSKDVQKLNQDQNLTLKPFTFYIRKNITGAAGTYKLIEDASDYKEGVINLNNRKFDAGNAMLFHKMAIRYGNGATGDSPASLKYDKAFPGVLRNSDIIADQNGREVLRKPLADFIVEGTPTSPNEVVVDLGAFRYLKDNLNFRYSLEVPSGLMLEEGATAATSNHFIEILSIGHQTDSKS